MSKFYSRRIELDLMDAVINTPELKTLFKTWAGAPKERRPRMGIRASKTVEITAWISFFLWSVIFIVGVLFIINLIEEPSILQKTTS